MIVQVPKSGPCTFREDKRGNDGQTSARQDPQKPSFHLSRFRGMMNTPRLAAQFLGVAIRDTARLAARCFIGTAPTGGQDDFSSDLSLLRFTERYYAADISGKIAGRPDNLKKDIPQDRPNRPRQGMPMKEAEIRKFDYIDALKGFAILGIVFAHTVQWVIPSSEFLNGYILQGVVGVQLFYFISAYTLCWSMDRRSQSEPHPVRNFFIRRFFRIAPLFYLDILIYLLYMGLTPRFWAPNGLQWWFIPLTVLFLHGWHPETMNSVVPGASVIAVEAAFYFVFPFLFSRLKSFKTTLIFLAGSIILAKILAIAVHFFLIRFYNPYTDYLVYAFADKWFFAQLPVFLTGILLYHAVRRFADLRDKTLGLALLTLAGIMLVAFYDIRSYKNILSEDCLYGFAFAVLAFALAVHPLKILVNPVTNFVGRISYGIFLFHFGVIIILQKIFPGGFPVQGNIGPFAALAIVFPLSAGVSYVLTRLIEKPFMGLGRRIIARG
jgi:peptidoglycan/LPS O-acetylase OafA/YrhL